MAAAAKQGQLSVDVAGLDNENPALPPGTPTYTRPGAATATPLPPPQRYQPPPQQVAEAEAATEAQTGSPAPIAIPVVDEKKLIQQDLPPQQTIEYAAACGALKQSIVGDWAIINRPEVEQYIQHGSSGRIMR